MFSLHICTYLYRPI